MRETVTAIREAGGGVRLAMMARAALRVAIKVARDAVATPEALSSLLAGYAQAIQEALDSSHTNPLCGGALIRCTDGATANGITWTAGGSVTLTHGLGRVPLLVHVFAPTGGYASFQVTALNDRVVTIQSANACTAPAVWVGGG